MNIIRHILLFVLREEGKGGGRREETREGGREGGREDRRNGG